MGAIIFARVACVFMMQGSGSGDGAEDGSAASEAAEDDAASEDSRAEL